MWNVSFERNSATSEGPAISNIGDIDNMGAISFNDNYFSCNVGEFLENFDVEVSRRMLMNVRILFPRTTFCSGTMLHAPVSNSRSGFRGMGTKCIVTSPSSSPYLPFWASLLPYVAHISRVTDMLRSVLYPPHPCSHIPSANTLKTQKPMFSLSLRIIPYMHRKNEHKITSYILQTK